jgi:hypothetical protein
MNSNVSLPYNLSLQFSLSRPEKKVYKNTKHTKVRNKRIKDKEEYDILQIDEQIKQCFIIEKRKITDYDKRLLSMINTLSNLNIPFGVNEVILTDINNIVFNHKESKDFSKSLLSPVLTYRDFLNFYDQLQRLLIKIKNISSNLLYDKYITLTQPILLEYKQILLIPIKITFLSKKKPKRDSVFRKNILTDNYLKIASNFIDIEYTQKIIPVVDKQYSCNCGNTADFETKEGVMICENCGVEISVISSQTSFKDIDRINMHQKYKYEKKSHFREGISQFQGKQNKFIDPSLYIKADRWLLLHNLLNIKADNKKEKYLKVAKDHLRLFLSESEDEDLTKHYEDLHLIFSTLTGTPCPDISNLEEKLYNQFDKLVEAFLSMEDIERTNILNSQFVLKKLLLINKYNIDPQDFPGLKTASRQAEHESLFISLCRKAGLNHPDDTSSAIKDIPKSIHDHTQ